ncbi:Hint domain-containing protein [Roseovarius sp. S4756]|uniref:Hint domain-containing protein n=1 Tax=Roseovarius maritimus TaxID=3342637 RepID=UPI00372723BF
MFEWIGTPGETPPAASDGQGRDVPGVGQAGVSASVCVAGSNGWPALGTIAPGDLVLTFDAGLQPVAEILREPAWAGRGPLLPSLWLVEIPIRALGNREVMHLAADQLVLIESDVAEAVTGDPFALVPARSLGDVRGIHRVPPQPGDEIITLTFAEEQIVFAGGGAMLQCPAATSDLLEAPPSAPSARGYPRLSAQDAREVAIQMDEAAPQARSAGLPGINS